jgi:hypothetical protein
MLVYLYAAENMVLSSSLEIASLKLLTNFAGPLFY